MQKYLPWVATVLSVFAVSMQFVQSSSSVTKEHVEKMQAELDDRITLTRDSSMGQRNIDAKAITGLMRRVEEIDANRDSLTQLLNLVQQKMESDSKLNQIQTEAITTFSEDLKKLKKELNIE